MGFELGGTMKLDMGLAISLALTASRNTYREYLVDSVHYGNPGKYADYANNKMAGIPDLFFNVGVKYSPVGMNGAFIRANLQYVGSYFVNDANTIHVASSTILNAGAGIDHMNIAGDRFYITLFMGVNNLTDLKYVGSTWLNPDLVNGTPLYIEPGLPRNYVGTVSLGVNL